MGICVVNNFEMKTSRLFCAAIIYDWKLVLIVLRTNTRQIGIWARAIWGDHLSAAYRVSHMCVRARARIRVCVDLERRAVCARATYSARVVRRDSTVRAPERAMPGIPRERYLTHRRRHCQHISSAYHCVRINIKHACARLS